MSVIFKLMLFLQTPFCYTLTNKLETAFNNFGIDCYQKE